MAPVTEILKDAVTATRMMSWGIESYPMREYIYQTTFLQMTGASEQKLKCICWNIATFDYNLRYKILSDKIGECSDIKEKKAVYKHIQEALTRLDSTHVERSIGDMIKSPLVQPIIDKMQDILGASLFAIWDDRDIKFLKSDRNTLVPSCHRSKKSQKINENQLSKSHMDFYENVVYRHRNRCAHNLRSYQSRHFDLQILSSSDHNMNNYFNMFLTLAVLDRVFINAYEEYLAKFDLQQKF